jgi:hypothetical protein
MIWGTGLMAVALMIVGSVSGLTRNNTPDAALRVFHIAVTTGRTAGWTAGANVRLDYRWAGTDTQRATAAAQKLRT